MPPRELAQTPTVLVVEDAPEIRIFLEETLRKERFDVQAVETGEEGVAAVEASKPDLVVLDLVLPGIDGYETCRRIREISDAYVLMLTAKRAEIDRVVGLSVGADDYLVKPFYAAELVARLRAMLRRPRADADRTPNRHIGDLELDLNAHTVQAAGRFVELTRIEFALLAALMDNPRKVVAREELLNRIWGPRWSGEHHLVEVHVSKLRRKLGDDPVDPRYVATVRGIGYRMVDPEVRYDSRTSDASEA